MQEIELDSCLQSLSAKTLYQFLPSHHLLAKSMCSALHKYELDLQDRLKGTWVGSPFYYQSECTKHIGTHAFFWKIA